MNINKIQLNVLYMWNMINIQDPQTIINIKYMNEIIQVHEFILKKHFSIYEILKNDFVIQEGTINLDFSSTIISDEYHLEYKYFELIIKYYYGFVCDLKGITINDLFKIHAFLTKHCMENTLLSSIENKIHYLIYHLPIIDICDGKNKLKDYKINYQIRFMYGMHEDKNELESKMCRHGISHYYKTLVSKFINIPIELIPFGCMKIPHNTINNLQELFDKYDEYLFDEQIYNYSLSFILKKYKLDIDKYNFKLPNDDIYINNYTQAEADEYIINNLGYFNIIKHKFYTMSFLNKSFKNINMKKIFTGQYKTYIYYEHIYTIHAIIKCAELEKNTEPKKIC